MGECCITNNLDNANNNNSKNDIKPITERNIIIENQNKQRIENIIKIKKFIIKNGENYQRRKNFKEKLSFYESVFCNPVTDPNFDYNFYKNNYEHKLKEMIEQKKTFFKELFPDEKLLKINSFDIVKEKLSNYYNDDIYENKINFYKNFVHSIQENEKVKRAYVKKSPRKSLNTNFINFMAKNSTGNIFESQQIYSGFGALNFGNINLGKEQKYIKKDIEVLYKYCFTIDKLPNFEVCEKRSKILSLIADFENYKKLNISDEFRNFIRALYHIILLKKFGCLANTGNTLFYAINKNIKYLKPEKTVKFGEESEEDLLKKQLQNLKKAADSYKKKPSNLKIRGKSRHLTTGRRGKKNSMIAPFIYTNLNSDFSREKNETTVILNNRLKFKRNSNFNLIHKEITQDITQRRKPNKKKLKTVIERNPSVVFKTIERHSKFFNKRKSKILQEEFYSGQYDKTTYLYCGYGTLIEPDKNICYTGTFRYGEKEGIGILYEDNIANNMIICFIGEFRNNTIQGYGAKINLKKNIFIFKEGLFNDQIFLQGKVKMMRENTVKEEIDLINYDGDVSQDLFNGFGYLNQRTYALNDLKNYAFEYEKDYKGQFKNGKENGKGILRYISVTNDDSYQYTGHFVNGLRDGFGVITYGENYFIQKFEGFFREDKPFATYGIAYFKSGDKYEGFFNADYQKDYVGSYSFFDPVSKVINENYFGGFLKDSKHGLGKVYTQNNDGCRILNGNFNRGDKQGFFEMNEYKIEMVKQKVKDNSKRKRLTLFNYGELYENKMERNQNKQYILFEENEIMEKNDIPFD